MYKVIRQIIANRIPELRMNPDTAQEESNNKRWRIIIKKNVCKKPLTSNQITLYELRMNSLGMNLEYSDTCRKHIMLQKFENVT
jgi:hypothetical protein